jgi:hypothetical protein
VHLAQAKNYLVAYDKPIGLLINFGSTSLQIKKVFNKKYNLNPEKNQKSQNQDLHGLNMNKMLKDKESCESSNQNNPDSDK